jgi:hypothetical protein
MNIFELAKECGFYVGDNQIGQYVTTHQLEAFANSIREATIRECADVVSDWQSEDSNMTAGESIIYNLLDY